MFRNISIFLVVCLVISSCNQNKKQISSYSKSKFNTKAYYKNNQNSRVINILSELQLLNSNPPQEIFFVNRAGCNSCVNSKYEEILEILYRTKINTLVIFNDSLYFLKLKNEHVTFQFLSTNKLKSSNLFHSTPWFYNFSDGKVIDKKLTVKTCDSLLKRFID